LLTCSFFIVIPHIYSAILCSKVTSTVLYADGTGLYSYTYSSCTGYDDEYGTPNTKWNSAKAFSIIAVSVGGIALFASCVAFGQPKLWLFISLALAITTLFQGLTFLFLSSNACTITGDQVNSMINHENTPDMVDIGQNCILSSGANAAISATVIWFVSAVAAALAGMKGAPEQADEAAKVKQQEVPVAQPEEAVQH
jgi:hypothetical protein